MWIGFLLAILQVVLGATSVLLALLLLLRRGRSSLSNTLGDELVSILGGPVSTQLRITQFTVALGGLWVTAFLAVGLITSAEH